MDVIVVADHSAAILARIHEELKRAVGQTASAIQTRAQRRIAEPPKTGRIYTRPFGPNDHRPYPHQASAPGEAPANWTGQLHDSVETGLPTGRAADIVAEVRVNAKAAPYGVRLEFGSPSGRLAPRPFFYKSADEESQPFVERVTEGLERACG